VTAYPTNYFWLAEDGRVFSSLRETTVSGDDADYLAFKQGYTPRDWPRDEAGEQSDAALHGVLGPHRIFVNLSYYTTHVRDIFVNSGITVNGRPFATDPITLSSLNSAAIYTQGKGNLTFSWKLPDGSWVTLSNTDILALQNAVSKHGQDCFDCEADTLDAIAAGTVTTREQVDAAFAAVQDEFNDVTMLSRKPKQK
jgi:hypothetical protein